MKRCFAVIALMLLFGCPIIFAADQAEERVLVNKMVSFIALGTGSTTGTYFPLGAAMANTVSIYGEDIEMMPHSTRGSVDNLKLIAGKELNMAIAQSDTIMAAVNGEGAFKNAQIANLKVVMALYPEVIQIVVPAASDITSVKQLKGKRVIVGPLGSGNLPTTMQLLKAYGIGQDDFEAIYISYDDAIQYMGQGMCDALIVIAGLPTGAVKEIGNRMKIRLISIPLSEIVELVGKLPYLSAFTIPRDMYSHQSQKTDTVALTAMLVCDGKLSDSLVYNVDKAIFNHLDYLRSLHERANDISINSFSGSILPKLLHNGSKKFYKEHEGLK